MPDQPGFHALVGSPDPLALTNLATGGMIGAVGAVVAAVILGVFEALRRRIRRGEQITFVRRLIESEFTGIRDTISTNARSRRHVRLLSFQREPESP